ncbi:AsmA family protein [Ferrovibrio xuzhouensis]|uniref:AsmA family protein n=1 Tax=Ferrovibrio xuzhouensis TaxID=1576914 RepID=A0ABV7VIZ6_9PROT
MNRESPQPAVRPSWRRWLLGSLTVLVVVIGGTVALFDWNWLRDPVASALSDATGRNVRLDGDLSGQWSLHPRLVIEDFHMANADWAAEPEMAAARRIEVVIDLPALLHGRIEIPDLRLVDPKIDLERQADGRSNWTLGAKEAADAATPDDRHEMPVIGRLSVENGRLRYRDAKAGLDIDTRISTVTGQGGTGQGGQAGGEMRLEGEGRLHGEPFRLTARGGSLLALREGNDPYPLTVDARVGETRGRISGTLADPIRFEGLNLDVALTGPNLGRLTRITGVPLPATPPYDLKGHLRRDGAILRIEDMAGRVGNSDLAGKLRIDTGRERLFIGADLHSKVLDYRDIGPLIGLSPPAAVEAAGGAPQPKQASAAPPAAGKAAPSEPAPASPPAGDAPPPRVLPDAPLAAEQIRAVDAKVTFHGDKVEAPNVPLNAVDLDLTLQDGLLLLKPLRLGVAGGQVNADIRLDARHDPVTTDYDIRLSKFRLERFLDSAGLSGSGNGIIDGRIRLTGQGDSVRKSLGSANGNIRFVIDHGTISNLAVALAGLDIARALGLWATGDAPIPLRCFVADFDVRKGVMTPKTFVLDSSNSTLTAEGNVSLADEQLDLRLLAHPKTPTLVSARTPITVSGAFSRPSVGVEAAPLGARAAGAAALGVLLTPLASILAFIDPGLAQDSDCAALIHAAGPKAGGGK